MSEAITNFKYTKIPLPCVLEWDEILCQYRGTVRPHKETIVERRGRNFRTESGDWLWWPTVLRGINHRITKLDTKP